MNILDHIPHKVIVNCERDPYLIRWYLLRSKFIAVFLHKFVRSDEDRALHDHPWNFLVIPLWRGYVEHSSEVEIIPTCYGDTGTAFQTGNTIKRRVWPIIGTRFRRAEYRHRVELVKGKPSWSLFIRFKERRVWGFWPKDGFQAWNDWWKEKCE
jgi:hypothetical protein